MTMTSVTMAQTIIESLGSLSRPVQSTTTLQIDGGCKSGEDALAEHA